MVPMSEEQSSSPSSRTQEGPHWLVAYARLADEEQASGAFDIAAARDLVVATDMAWKRHHVEQLALAARRPSVVHCEQPAEAAERAITRGVARALTLTPAFGERMRLDVRLDGVLLVETSETPVLHWYGCVTLTHSVKLWLAGFSVRCTCPRGAQHRDGFAVVS